MKKRQEHSVVPATSPGPRPADFPLGSVESRAAVRAMINRRATQKAKPDIYRASWVGHPHDDEDFEILDIDTGLPVSGGTRANGTQSAAAVQQDEGLRGVATNAAAVPTHEIEIVSGKAEEFEILDL